MKKPWQIYGYPKPKSEASRGTLSLVDWEIYSGIEIPEKPVFIRLDGWKFHPLCKRLKLKKPYDRRFASALVKTSKEFFKTFSCNLAYIFSDEINLLFLKVPGFKRIEKIDSVFAGIASSTFSELMKTKASFDCRCIPMLKKSDIINYLIWRQAECFRNHNNSWAHQMLMKSGLSASRAQKRLSGMNTAQIQKLVKERFNLDLFATPAWQRSGILLYKEKYLKEGYDPIKKKKVKVFRFKVKEDWSPPDFRDKGKKFINSFL
ncbi:MAG: tRNA(His) guanylyltransferase Thg1 family protein [Candidatus Aenigmatarchaeota archaeon]